MLVFLYMLAAMGVAYWAKLHRRNPVLWFAASIIFTPLGSSLAIMALDRYGR
ncbi:MAG: hypothetical protein JF627_01695 [Alphaproteobacteria bacterium]|nr:hypothetical protein [Alphaproteobacteria bacterium]